MWAFTATESFYHSLISVRIPARGRHNHLDRENPPSPFTLLFSLLFYSATDLITLLEQLGANFSTSLKLNGKFFNFYFNHLLRRPTVHFLLFSTNN